MNDATSAWQDPERLRGLKIAVALLFLPLVLIVPSLRHRMLAAAHRGEQA